MGMDVKLQLGREVECPLCHQLIDHVEVRPSSDADWLFDYDCPKCLPWIFRDISNSLSAEAVLERIEQYRPETRETGMNREPSG
jgi:hypothetical protein